MKKSISAFLALIFIALSFIHFYWVLGGHWAFNNAIPTNENGQKVLAPSNIDTIIVGGILLLFALIYLSQIAFINLKFPDWLIKYATFFIPVVFILRAIGDFKYVGFLKSVVNTEFSYMDTFFYSPLCLVIGFSGLIIKLLNKQL